MKIEDESSLEYTYDIVLRQLNLFWPTKAEKGFKEDVQMAVDKTKEAFNESTRFYYLKQGFSVLNTSVYSVFLYYLAHRIGMRGG